MTEPRTWKGVTPVYPSCRFEPGDVIRHEHTRDVFVVEGKVRRSVRLRNVLSGQTSTLSSIASKSTLAWSLCGGLRFGRGVI